MPRVGGAKKPSARCLGNMQFPVYRSNLELFRSHGIRCTARFAVAMKDPRHPLGKLFAGTDLRQAPAILKALENKDRDQLEYCLQFLFSGERIMVKHALGDLFREQRLSEITEAERELREETPEATRKGWEAARQKVEKKLARMGPKGRAQYWEAVRRALFSLRQEQAIPKEEPPQITSQRIVVSVGPDGRIALDFISSTFSEEYLERAH